MAGPNGDHPSLGWDAEQVEAYLAANPEVMYRIFGDMYSIVKDEEAKAEGHRRVGRRPMRAADSIDEMLATVLPEQYATKPFPQALRELMGRQSQRTFSRKVPCHQTTLSRLLSGELSPDLETMECLARAAGAHPSWFAEWRAQAIATVIRSVLERDPQLSIRMFREVT